jgi:hypothetical protein
MIRLVLHPIVSAIIIHANIPIIPPAEWAAFNTPIESPTLPLPAYLAISVMLEAKKNAIPTPTIKRSKINWAESNAMPKSNAAIEDRAMPRIADVRGLYLTAKMPAGTWNMPTPRKKAVDIEPSKKISCLNWIAISGNIAATLNQFTP